MTANLDAGDARPPNTPGPRTADTALGGRETSRDAVHLAAERIAGAAFCGLHPAALTFSRGRVAAHFDVPDDEVDMMISAGLLSLVARLDRISAGSLESDLRPPARAA